MHYSSFGKSDFDVLLCLTVAGPAPMSLTRKTNNESIPNVIEDIYKGGENFDISRDTELYDCLCGCDYCWVLFT